MSRMQDSPLETAGILVLKDRDEASIRRTAVMRRAGDQYRRACGACRGRLHFFYQMKNLIEASEGERVWQLGPQPDSILMNDQESNAPGKASVVGTKPRCLEALLLGEARLA